MLLRSGGWRIIAKWRGAQEQVWQEWVCAVSEALFCAPENLWDEAIASSQGFHNGRSMFQPTKADPSIDKESFLALDCEGGNTRQRSAHCFNGMASEQSLETLGSVIA